MPAMLSRRFFHSNLWWGFCCLFVVALLSGCATYRPVSLTPDTVEKRLTPPAMQEIRILADKIEHPILKPVDFDYRNGFSPDEAALLAVVENPALKAIRDRKGIASAQVLQAGILPNPQLSYSFDNPIGDAKSGTVNALGFGLSLDVASLVTRSASLDAARANAASVDLETAWQEWQVAEAAKMHVYRLVIAGEKLELAKRVEDDHRKAVDSIREGVEIGENTILELTTANGALMEAKSAVLSAKQEVKSERLALNRALGFPADTILPLEQDIGIPSWEDIPSREQALEGIEDRRLDLVALRMGYESQEARVRKAIKSQFPRISIGPTAARGTDNLTTAGFGVSISLPIFDHNQGHIAAERATRQQLFDEYLARLFEARADVSRALAEISGAKARLKAVDESISTKEELVQIYKEAAQENIIPVINYYQALIALDTKREEKLKLKRDIADLGIALEIADGRYFVHDHGNGSKYAAPHSSERR
jgi:outer membrane protein TolC